MKVFIEKEDKTVEIKFEGAVEVLLGKLKINRETVLVVKNGALATKEEHLDDSDDIKLLSIISGG
ncbi:MAG: MoaD/ThiS family protein [Candidatus Nanoarchaeia archaeon]